MSETKRRLLLSKWRDEVIALRAMAKKQAAEIGELKKDVKRLEGELEDAEEDIKAAEDDQNWRTYELEEILTDVKYWLHDGLVHRKLVSDPRRILRKVEDALG